MSLEQLQQLVAEKSSDFSHEDWIAVAWQIARYSERQGEVPVGALVVSTGKKSLIAYSTNGKETLRDPTAHAEIRAIQKASQILGRWRLDDCSLYVTHEPCLMCAGAIIQSRISYLYYGAKSPKYGAVSHFPDILSGAYPHKCEVRKGFHEKACKQLMKKFFEKKRN